MKAGLQQVLREVSKLLLCEDSSVEIVGRVRA